ncbi:MAG TPA: insulinase family protein [Planctomycetota bacterium]|nr:insulinase family protein [Planctomycetota bacterium]
MPAHPADARAWPPGTPDLPADPSLHFGQLDNGVRFVWTDVPRPAGRCSLRLVVCVGGLDEADDEQGMAHFVEHMAFNGTRRFPGNSIGEWFRSHGMRSGQHANAFTSSTDTTYCVDLPDNEQATIRDGLDVLRQFTDAVLFAPTEVDAEKGVIDAEERERSSPRARARASMRARLLAGMRTATRNVIGAAAQRANFTADRLRAFHDRWYRADNLTLVLAGDLEARPVEQLCRDAFGSLPAPTTPLPARAGLGSPTLTDTVFAIDEPDRHDVEWFVQCPGAPAATLHTADSLRLEVLEEAAAEMARWTLVHELEQSGSAVMDVDVTQVHDELPAMLVTFRCEPARTTEALEACARVVRSRLQRGFSRQLLDRVRTAKVAELDRDLAAYLRVDSAGVARWLANTLAAGEVPADWSFVHDLLRAAWADLTIDSCNGAWRAAWSAATPSLVSIGPPGHGVDAAAIWRRAADGELPVDEAPAAAPRPHTVPPDPAASWPYASRSVEGTTEPVERRHDQALDLEDLRLPNGVHALVKATRLAPGQILVAANVGAGQSQLTERQLHAAQLFELMLPRSGLGKLPAGALRRLVSTRTASVSMRCEPGRFLVRGQCDRESLAFQLEWLLAQCTDTDLDEDVRSQVAEANVSRFALAKGSSTEATLGFLARLAGQSLGYVPEQVAAVGLDEVREFFAAFWSPAPITLVVVGDLDVEQTIALAARTFGRLPPRRSPEALAAGMPYRPVTVVLHEEHDLTTTEDNSTVALFAPLPDLQGLVKTRAQVLALMLGDRFEARLREAMGAIYSCQASGYELATASRCSVLWIRLKVAPGRESEVLAAARQELAAIATHGVTAAELDGVRAQVLNERQRQRQTNLYWLDVLSGAHRDPAALRDLVQGVDEVRAWTPEQLSADAATYLAADQVSSLVLRARPKK